MTKSIGEPGDFLSIMSMIGQPLRLRFLGITSLSQQETYPASNKGAAMV
jgi:hypothetical protein